MADAGAIRAGRAYVELGMNNDPLNKALAASAARLKSWGESIGSLGRRIFAFGGGIVGTFGLIAKAAGEAALDLDRMSIRTGVLSGDLSALSAALRLTGSSSEGMEGALSSMESFIQSAVNGGGEAIITLQRLGVNLRELQRGDPVSQLEALATGFQRLGMSRSAMGLASQVFGTRDILPSLRAGGQALRDAMGRAGASGMSQSSADIRGLADMQRGFIEVRAAMSQVTSAIGSSLAPMLTALAGGMQRAVYQATQWIQRNRGLFTALAAGAGVIATTGVVLIGLGAAMKIAALAFTVATPVVWALSVSLAILKAGVLATIAVFSSPALLFLDLFRSAVTAIAYASIKTATLRQDWRGLGTQLRELGSTASTVFSGLASDLAAGDLDSAWGTVVEGMETLWIEAVYAMKTAWRLFKQTISEAIEDSGLKPIIDAWKELTSSRKGGGGKGGGKGEVLESMGSQDSNQITGTPLNYLGATAPALEALNSLRRGAREGESRLAQGWRAIQEGIGQTFANLTGNEEEFRQGLRGEDAVTNSGVAAAVTETNRAAERALGAAVEVAAQEIERLGNALETGVDETNIERRRREMAERREYIDIDRYFEQHARDMQQHADRAATGGLQQAQAQTVAGFGAAGSGAFGSGVSREDREFEARQRQVEMQRLNNDLLRQLGGIAAQQLEALRLRPLWR